MTASLVTTARVSAVAIVTLNRPERRNALSRELADQLTDRLAEVVADGARAIVLAAAGPVFSAGGDLEDLMSVVAEGAEATSAAVYRHFHGLVRALRSCPVPIRCGLLTVRRMSLTARRLATYRRVALSVTRTRGRGSATARSG